MKIEMKPVSYITTRLDLQPYGKAHTKFASECRDRMNARYVPYKEGGLVGNSRVDEQCNIHYETLYARFLYYGKLMVDPETGSSYAKKYHKKVLTDKDLVYHKPGTGPFWDQKMVSAEMSEIEEVMNNYIKQRGRE